jgi:hypothetical protein
MALLPSIPAAAMAACIQGAGRPLQDLFTVVRDAAAGVSHGAARRASTS